MTYSFCFLYSWRFFFVLNLLTQKKKAYNILVGVAIGFAILTKWLPALIVIPIWYILVYDSGKFSKNKFFIQLALLVFVLVVVALPWQIYSAKAFPLETAWEQYYNNLHLTEALKVDRRPDGFF
ncbi:MAG: glycosyltransferase family 39 protein [Sphingobacteriales bacterium]|nr:glycosyltransferase family 39 protein [Sphingobacteriales bacterium]